MLSSHRTTRGSKQRGVALLIAIFALVLISAVGISLILMAGTESGINVNYRRSTTAFYAAQAGLEEARERLVVNAPDTLRANAFLPDATPPKVVPGQVLYILNPGPNDPAFNPQSDPPTSPYYDNEYQSEFAVLPVPNPGQVVNSSAMTTAGGQPPLPYKWVRITLKSEAMGGIDLDGNAILDPNTPVLALNSNTQCVPATPQQASCSSDPSIAPITAQPIYRVTAMSLAPGGGSRLLQAEVAETSVIGPNGAIASQAGVKLNGNFNALGGWPPIATASCGSGKNALTIQTCGTFSNGNVAGDCNNPYDPTTDTCNGLPRSHKDYCNVGNAVNGVTSAGSITSGNYSLVPDQTTACSYNKPGCIFTDTPLKALYPNFPNWPYDMNQIIKMFQPPVTEPITNVSGISCGTFDQYGNRTCNGQGVQIGTLPSPWPPPPSQQTLNNTPRYVFADVGPGGLLKLTGGSSGSGILVVNGDVSLEGGFQWYGLILAHGVVTFLGGGSPSTNLFGAVLAGRDINNNNTTSGGSVSIIYDLCAFRNNNQNQPLRYLSFREITCTPGAGGITTCR